MKIMSKKIYLKNKTTQEEEPPIEVEIETGDRVEHIIELVVDYWDLGDRGDYKLVKNSVDLDDTRRVSDTNIKTGDTLWLLEKDGKEPVYTSNDYQLQRKLERKKERERRQRELEKKKERERRQRRKALYQDDISEKVKDWIEEEIGVPKTMLHIEDITVNGDERTYLVKDTMGHDFEVLIEGYRIKNYRPLKPDD